MKSIVIVNNDTMPHEHTNENITSNLACESGEYCVIRETMDGYVNSSNVQLGEVIHRDGGVMSKAHVTIGDETVPCILWERADTSEFNFIAVDNKYAI